MKLTLIHSYLSYLAEPFTLGFCRNAITGVCGDCGIFSLGEFYINLNGKSLKNPTIQ